MKGKFSALVLGLAVMLSTGGAVAGDNGGGYEAPRQVIDIEMITFVGGDGLLYGYQIIHYSDGSSEETPVKRAYAA